jgi:hypothetical protein
MLERPPARFDEQPRPARPGAIPEAAVLCRGAPL